MSMPSAPPFISPAHPSWHVDVQRFPVIIEEEANGYVVECPSFQGCFTQGDTYEEAMERIRDLIRVHLARGSPHLLRSVAVAPSPNSEVMSQTSRTPRLTSWARFSLLRHSTSTCTSGWVRAKRARISGRNRSA